MSRLLSFALALILVAQFNAQITVSVADFASAADTVRISKLMVQGWILRLLVPISIGIIAAW